MNFRRPRIVHQFPDFAPPSTVVQTPLLALLLGDGSITDYIAIPTPTYDTTCLVEQNINGNRQIILGVDVVALDGLVDLTGVIEFQEPNNPNFWYPSKEPACDGAGGIEQPLRTDAIASQEWVITTTGKFLIASRVEHPHFKKFRVRFRSAGGPPGAGTDIRIVWYHDGGEAMVPEQ